MATFEEFRERHRARMEEIWKIYPSCNEIWLQASCTCEYCGLDLLESHHAFRGAESDHLLSKALYPNLQDDLSNYTMACASCHKLKHQLKGYDPASEDKKFHSVDHLTDEDRRELIVRVAKHIAVLRVEQQENLQQFRNIRDRYRLSQH